MLIIKYAIKVFLVIFSLNSLVAFADSSSNELSVVHIDSDSIKAMTIDNYLDYLKKLNGSSLFVSGTLTEWPSVVDISYLLSRVDDFSSCSSVNSKASSILLRKSSTIGREVKYLLLSIMEGQYPPRLSSLSVEAQELDQAVKWAKSEIKKPN